MAIQVIIVDHSAWMEENAQNLRVLGEFADERESLTEIWRHLVQCRERAVYLLFHIDSSLKVRQMPKPVVIVFGGIFKGVARIQQEEVKGHLAEKLAKFVWIS